MAGDDEVFEIVLISASDFLAFALRGPKEGCSLIFRFENFSLDGGRRELRRGSELISIEPQVFDVLEFLIVNRQRVVSSDDLIKAVWQGRIVSEGTVSTRINAVRNAVCDSGREQRLVRTVIVSLSVV